jgi:hypothetical protein
MNSSRRVPSDESNDHAAVEWVRWELFEYAWYDLAVCQIEEYDSQRIHSIISMGRRVDHTTHATETAFGARKSLGGPSFDNQLIMIPQHWKSPDSPIHRFIHRHDGNLLEGIELISEKAWEYYVLRENGANDLLDLTRWFWQTSTIAIERSISICDKLVISIQYIWNARYEYIWFLCIGTWNTCTLEDMSQTTIQNPLKKCIWPTQLGDAME